MAREQEEGVRRCDKAECNNQLKVSAGNNESGEVRLAITKQEVQQSKPVDPTKYEPDGRTMEEPPSLATPFPLL